MLTQPLTSNSSVRRTSIRGISHVQCSTASQSFNAHFIPNVSESEATYSSIFNHASVYMGFNDWNKRQIRQIILAWAPSSPIFQPQHTICLTATSSTIRWSALAMFTGDTAVLVSYRAFFATAYCFQAAGRTCSFCLLIFVGKCEQTSVLWGSGSRHVFLCGTTWKCSLAHCEVT